MSVTTSLSCFFMVFIAPFFLYAAEPSGEADLEEGRARIRIWRESLPERVGHVSLATRNSYISLWPSSEERKFDPAGGGYVISAVASNVENYGQDLVNEDDLEPNFVFEIGLDASKIDTAWRNLRTTVTATVSGTNSVLLPGITWLALSHPLTIGRLEFNCASAALAALELGGLDTFAFVRNKVRSLEMVASLHGLVSELEDKTFRELGEAGILYGSYSSIIKPSDIRNFLNQHIDTGYKRYFHDLLRSRTLNISGITEGFETEIVLKKLLEARTREDDKYYEYILRGFRDLGCEIEEVETRFFISSLSVGIRSAIESATIARQVLGAGAGAALAIGGVALLHRATDGECSIM